MQLWEILLLVSIGWNFVGLIWWAPMTRKYHFRDLLNPVKVYKKFEVNWFGAILVSILNNLICPIVSIYYWICFICTVGRNDKNGRNS